MIYLDHAATTPLDPEVLQAMLPYFGEGYGNASSQHVAGQRALNAVDAARDKVAAVLGCKPLEVYFTSGGSESDNWALRGVAKANADKGRHIVTTTVEHHAVLNCLKEMEAEGYQVTYVPVDGEGMVDLAALEAAIRPDTVLVSVMYANNEVGTVEPIAQVAAICREKGVLLHVDAVQAAGALPLDVGVLGVDLLSLSAHKFYGPKGVGCLYVRKGVRLAPLIAGGAQERGLRGGTYNTPGIVGMARALELAAQRTEADCQYIRSLRDAFVDEVIHRLDGVTLNGSVDDRLPSNANLRFAGVRGDSLLVSLDMAGIAAGLGSACTAGTTDPSHVLLAMGLAREEALSSLRFTFGRHNTADEVHQVVDALASIVARLRK